MEQLLCISIISFILFFRIGAEEIPGQIILIDRSTFADEHDEFIALFDDGCECIKYDCGCCSEIEWDAVSLHGRICANASYLEHDYGFSLTVTYNNFAIINETVSARNPPPICVGEDIVDALEVEICLHIYNINIESDKFHACFEILLKALKIRITKVSLGCIDTKQYEQMQYIVDNTVSNLFHTNVTSNVSNISLPVDKMERMIAANSRSSLSSHSLTEVFLFFVLFYWISVAHGIILY